MSHLRTNWTEYYKKTPHYASLARSITKQKLIRTLRKAAKRKSSFCELGGANSLFADAICRALDAKSYHIIDSNGYGLELLEGKRFSVPVSTELHDLLLEKRDEPRFDIVFSVGLIEHFTAPETKKLVTTHFQMCRPGGLVLMTFPTPTLLYRFLRSGSEALGMWEFPDERPLRFAEVTGCCSDYGDLLDASVNWLIGLTQGYLLYRKKSD